MGTILPGRFEPIRLLRKDRGCSTFVATDRGLGRNEVVVKLIGKGYFTSDTDALVDVFSWYRGLRHDFISEVLDAGVTAQTGTILRSGIPPSFRILHNLGYRFLEGACLRCGLSSLDGPRAWIDKTVERLCRARSNENC